MNKSYNKIIGIGMITFGIMSLFIYNITHLVYARMMESTKPNVDINSNTNSSLTPQDAITHMKVPKSNLNVSIKAVLDLQKDLRLKDETQKKNALNNNTTVSKQSLSLQPKPNQDKVLISTPKEPTSEVTQVVKPTPVIKNPLIEQKLYAEPVKSTNPVIGTNPFKGQKLYVDPASHAKLQADTWRLSRPQDALQIDKIATNSMARWMGDWNTNIEKDVNEYVTRVTNTGSLPVLVSYNIPMRDCNSYSAGGASSEESYRAWIRSFDKGIGNNKAIVILEPDALAGLDCLSQSDQDKRLSLLKDAVEVLKIRKTVSVYVDAGNSNWISVADMANRLQRISISKADGFALNVSNFYANTSLITYGQQLSSLVGDKHFVIDTSRNGLSQSLNYAWCNPSNRALGDRPTVSTGLPLVDAYLWIKNPGESDGTCNGGPNAGVWWPEYALGLAQRAGY